MKTGTQNHVKTKRLQRALGIPLYRAVGILETIWLLCIDCCDEGNIGKFTDQEIADYLEWEGDASDLVRCLSDSGWTDPDKDGRPVIHDWLVHCPEFVKDRIRKRRAREQKERNVTTYVSSEPDMSGNVRQVPDLSDLVPSIPNPTQPNPTQPIQTTTNHHQTPAAENTVVAGGDLWNMDSEAHARLMLKSTGYNRVEDLLQQSKDLGLSPGHVISACHEFALNKNRFDGPGAIAERLRSGYWPAEGVVTTEKAKINGHKRAKASDDAKASAIIRNMRAKKVPDDQIQAELEKAGLKWPN